MGARKSFSINKVNMFKICLDRSGRRAYLEVEHVQIRAEGTQMVPQANNANETIVVTYLAYLFLSIALTAWVARTLHKRGAIFLIDAFHGNAQLADSINHLLVVGFYLINIGFVSLALKTPAVISNSRSAIELLSDKMGMVLLILGGMHFFNLYVFSRIRRGSEPARRPMAPPVMPNTVLNAPVPR
jgi:hypothetical protein